MTPISRNQLLELCVKETYDKEHFKNLTEAAQGTINDLEDKLEEKIKRDVETSVTKEIGTNYSAQIELLEKENETLKITIKKLEKRNQDLQLKLDYYTMLSTQDDDD